MHRHCGTNNRAPRWTFTDPCKPEVRPGAREETASPAYVNPPKWPSWPLLGWGIFEFFSKIAEQILTKSDRKKYLNVIYQVCVFRSDRKAKMADLTSLWLIHFRFLLWKCWTEFNENWLEARSQHSLPILCFSGLSENQDDCSGLWLSETFSTSSLKPQNRMQWNLTGSKISISSRKLVFSGISLSACVPFKKVLMQVHECGLVTFCFRADRKTKMAALDSDWLRHFRLRLFKCWAEFNKTWQEGRSQLLLTSLCFQDWSENQDCSVSDWLRHFDLFSETTEMNSTELKRKLDLIVLYQVCVFWADRKTKMAARLLIG